MPRIPTYQSVVRQQVAAGFHQIDTHDLAGLTDHYARDLRHRFAGDHALGGERHDAATFVAWLGSERCLIATVARDGRESHGESDRTDASAGGEARRS